MMECVVGLETAGVDAERGEDAKGDARSCES